MPSTRIHGYPGHLIVERWSDDDSFDEFANHGDGNHVREARALFEFLSRHVSFLHTVKLLYKRLKAEFPEWDGEDEPLVQEEIITCVECGHTREEHRTEADEDGYRECIECECTDWQS